MVQYPTYKIIFASKFVVFNKVLLTVSNKPHPVVSTNSFSHRVVGIVRSIIDIFPSLGKVLFVLGGVVYNFLVTLAMKVTHIFLVFGICSTSYPQPFSCSFKSLIVFIYSISCNEFFFFQNDHLSMC